MANIIFHSVAGLQKFLSFTTMSTIRLFIFLIASILTVIVLVKCKHEPIIDPKGPQYGEATKIYGKRINGGRFNRTCPLPREFISSSLARSREFIENKS